MHIKIFWGVKSGLFCHYYKTDSFYHLLFEFSKYLFFKCPYAGLWMTIYWNCFQLGSLAKPLTSSRQFHFRIHGRNTDAKSSSNSQVILIFELYIIHAYLCFPFLKQFIYLRKRKLNFFSLFFLLWIWSRRFPETILL